VCTNIFEENFNKGKNLMANQRPLPVYIKYFLHKYGKLSACELTILIHSLIKSRLTFKQLQGQISSNLTKLKNDGEIMKSEEKKWKMRVGEEEIYV